jgi:hypothetical protein
MTKTKVFVLRFFVFLLVFAATVFTIIYVASNNHFGAFHDAGASIIVWQDTNGNGKRENNEPFLRNICVWAGYSSGFQYRGGWQEICNDKYFTTDSSGAWSDFFAGGSCSEIYNAVNPPENYFPTTPTIAKGCSAEFGLSKERPTVEIISQDIEQYLEKEDQKETTMSWVKFGIVVLLISVFSGFVSFKIIHPVR